MGDGRTRGREVVYRLVYSWLPFHSAEDFQVRACRPLFMQSEGRRFSIHREPVADESKQEYRNELEVTERDLPQTAVAEDAEKESPEHPPIFSNLQQKTHEICTSQFVQNLRRIGTEI